MRIKIFKVAAISDNTNAFGLKGVVIVAQDGQFFQIGVGLLSLAKVKRGTELTAHMGLSGALQHISEIVYETPSAKPKAPDDVVLELWGALATAKPAPTCTSLRLLAAITAIHGTLAEGEVTGIQFEDGSGYRFNYTVNGGEWQFIDLTGKIK